MDFLADIKTPDTSHITKFVPGPQWDCKPFVSFAARQGALHKVPVILRSPEPHLHIPYTELMYPSPQDENEGFYLSWFYFGLAAELYGLNEGPNRQLVLDQESAGKDFAALQQELIIERDGIRYVDGVKTMEKLRPRLRELMAAENVTGDGMRHLHSCLHLTRRMLDSIQYDFDEWIIISIAGLGEIISSALQVCKQQPASVALLLGQPLAQPDAFIWTTKAGKSQRLRRDMLQAGWCPGEIERAMTMHLGLASICSLSQLDRQAVRKDHSSCTAMFCRAFQIDMKTYELSHAEAGCSCSEYAVDVEEVERILLKTPSYPILCFSRDDNGSVTVTVEAYRQDTPYVALSHVWADGLGNPHENSIQQCQLARLWGLVLELQKLMRSPQDSSEYRFWIDTLCCPVELEGKWVALERIADVYSNATHVLVLDSSLSTYSSKSSPEEILLRIFGTSSWLRRLWTLQEGALSKSLCFQFSDGAVRDYDVAYQLQQAAKVDARLNVILEDIKRDLQRVHAWGPTESKEGRVDSSRHIMQSLVEAQWSLYFRTVTVPADEPLCLATLLSLNIGRVARAQTREDRMALIWLELADRCGGIPPRVIFTEDHPLQKAGFRWAPLSLLGSSSDSFYDVHTKATRFGMFNDSLRMGSPTSHGLRVVFSGYRIRVRPLAPNLVLHPWQGVVKTREDMLYLRLEPSGQWLRAVDSEHLLSKKGGTGSAEDEERWFRETGNRLCEAMHNGDAAIIEDDMAFDVTIADSKGTSHQSLLAHITSNHTDDPSPLQVRSFRPLVTSLLDAADVVVVEGLRHLAMRLADSDVTARCAVAKNRDDDSPEWLALRTEVREEMRRVAQEYWDANPSFAEAVGERVGPDMRDWVWIMIPKLFSHDIVLDSLPQDQVWIVD